MDSDDKCVNLIESIQARLQILIRVEPVLDHMHSIENREKELILNTVRAEGERAAAKVLIDTVLKKRSRSHGWFREFVDALSNGECRHAAAYMDVNRPPPEVEAENDNCVRLIELLSPTLVDMKTPEVCTQCAAGKVLTTDDVEKVNAETTNHGNQAGARELLRRIVRSPPGWFSTFLEALRETEHVYLYNELSGFTNDKRVLMQVGPTVEAGPGVEAGPAVEDSVHERLGETLEQSCKDLYNDEGSEPSMEQEDPSPADSVGGGAEGGAGGAGIRLWAYQQEVAAPALAGQNVIICLPTGSGKTRVAVYITKEHLEARRRAGRPGKVVVLVNKTPLVEQHYSSEFSPVLKPWFQVARVSGDSQLKISFPELVRSNNVIICTAQILENCLLPSVHEDDERVELSDLTLIVIDECHHTQKGDVYNNIMMRYLRQKHKNKERTKQGEAPVPLPQILGLTASPGVGGATNSMKAEEHILKICANLDACKIMTASNEEPKKLIKKVSIVEERQKDPFGDVIKNIMSAIHVHAGLHQACDFGTQNYEQWVVQREAQAAIEEDQKVRICAEHLLQYNGGLQLSNVIRMCDALEVLSTYQEEEMRRKQAPEEETPIQITDTEHFLFDLFKEKKDELQRLVKMPEHENNSLATLRVEILKEFTTREEARGIIFTKTRRSALALTQWIQENSKFADVGVLANCLIGGGDQSIVKPMTNAEQKDVLKKFRRGEVNLLIATSVAEEGLDIPECNIVMRYGLVTNEISMMQAQGRARAKNSSYTLVDVQGSGVVEKESVNEFRQKMMNKAIVRIKNMDEEEFNQKITNYQFEAMIERRMRDKKKKNKKLQSDSPSDVIFSCRGCSQKLCTGEEIEVIENMHHVVVSPQFRNCYNKTDNTNPQGRLVQSETNQFVACKLCGQQWGSMRHHRGIELPSLDVKNLVVTNKGQNISNCRRWHELAVRFPEFNLSAHASLMELTLDSEDSA